MASKDNIQFHQDETMFARITITPIHKTVGSYLSARYDCRGCFFVYLKKYIYIYLYIKKKKKRHSFYYTDLCLFLDGAFVRFGYVFSIYIRSKLFQANIQFIYICVLVLCVHTCSHFFFLLLHAYNAFDTYQQTTNRKNHQMAAMTHYEK